MRTVASILDTVERRLVPWRRARCLLFDLQLDVEVAEVRQRLESARARARRHDLLNAFTAVEGAATILTQETLSPPDRSKLARLLGSGLRRVRELQFAEPDGGPAALAELIDSLAEEPDWPAGVDVPADVDVDVACDLMVAGRRDEIAETIRQVIEHAGKRAPGGPLAIRGRRRGDRTELWVDDRGPVSRPGNGGRSESRVADGSSARPGRPAPRGHPPGEGAGR